MYIILYLNLHIYTYTSSYIHTVPMVWRKMLLSPAAEECLHSAPELSLVWPPIEKKHWKNHRKTIGTLGFHGICGWFMIAKLVYTITMATMVYRWYIELVNGIKPFITGGHHLVPLGHSHRWGASYLICAQHRNLLIYDYEDQVPPGLERWVAPFCTNE